MIFNAHSHLFNSDMDSEFSREAFLDSVAKFLNVSKEFLLQNPDPNFVQTPDAGNYVKTLDDAGIDGGLVMGIDFGLSMVGEAKWSVEEMNQWVANQVAEYPDKLYALCAVDPRRGNRAIKLVEKAVEEWGMKGVKIYPPCGFYPDDPICFPLYEKCVELDVPIFTHTGIYPLVLLGSKYADPIYLDGVAAKFPDLKIVMIHFGFPYWTEKSLEIMNVRPNMYADISANQSKAFSGTEQFLRLLHRLFEPNRFGSPIKERILFGTDWPIFETLFKEKDWLEWVKNIPEKAQEYGLKFKRSDIKKLLGLNAKKLLNF